MKKKQWDINIVIVIHMPQDMFDLLNGKMICSCWGISVKHFLPDEWGEDLYL